MRSSRAVVFTLSAITLLAGDAPGQAGATRGSEVAGTLTPVGAPVVPPLLIDAGGSCIVDLRQPYVISGGMSGSVEIDYRILGDAESIGTAQERTGVTELYFPPRSGPWEVAAAEDAGWNPAALEAAVELAERNNSTGLLILHRGRILAERYWDLAADDSMYTRYYHVGADAAGHPIEDVASIQKSVVSVLTAMAMDRGQLDVEQPVSALLGPGWSHAEPDTERGITVRHLMTMTSGLDEELRSLAPPGEAWIYSGAYKEMITVLEAASRQNIQMLTREWLLNPVGMRDSRWVPRSWAAGIPLAAPIGFATSARDAGRFGLLILAGGEWDGVRIVDASTLARTLEPSQAFNPSYGLLWWLNIGDGPQSESPMLRAIWGRQEGRIIRTAPEDLVAASGHGARRIYVVPSMALVVVRFGAAPPSVEHDGSGDSFDEALWRAIMKAGPAR